MKRKTSKLTHALVATLLFAGAFTTASSQTMDEFAARGEAIANQDPLAVEFRNRQPDDAARRGFDIGMAIAEGQTLPGPGKERICASLAVREQAACRNAVLFSVDRNRNASLASRGAAIAEADPAAAALRNADDRSVFYKLGFDIGLAAAGGDTIAGPGKDKIRDSLDPALRQGFSSAVSFALERNRNLGSASDESVSDRGGDITAEKVTDKGGVGKVIDRTGAGAVIDKTNSKLPNKSKRLILSVQASSEIRPVVSGKINVGQTATGVIYLAISYEDGTPFPLAKADDIHIETLRSNADAGAEATLNRVNPKAEDGIWSFHLPKIRPGNHFYLVSVVVEANAWNTTFQGRSIVRADYTRMPYWNAQRFDGTVWDPPK